MGKKKSNNNSQSPQPKSQPPQTQTQPQSQPQVQADSQPAPKPQVQEGSSSPSKPRSQSQSQKKEGAKGTQKTENTTANSTANSTSSKVVPTLGIRREDKNRWERRAPVAPQHVKALTEKGVRVIVQPSSLRTFPDRQYLEAGAIIQEDLSEAQTIISVKEVPAEKLLPKKTYAFFSHTIKAQPYNMPMLDNILEKKIRLVDYEAITDANGKRLVRFGKFAGYAGMIDTLHALGDRLLALGHSTPFLHLGFSYCYSNLETAKEAVKAMGEEIENNGLPKELVPLTFCFTSVGNVSAGAQEIFKLLPHKFVTGDEMVELVKNKDKASPFMVYGCVLTAQDFTVHKKTGKFDKNDYYKNPDSYECNFAEKYLPSVSVLMNCMYWEYRFPRLVTIKQMQQFVEAGKSRLIAIGDISCDPGGSVEFLMKTTSIDNPLFIYDPKNHSIHDSTTNLDYIYKPGILFIAIDNFPTEFPKEATIWFGDHLLPFLESLSRSSVEVSFEEQKNELPPEIYKAVLTHNGELTPRFKYIMDLRRENEKKYRRVLLLGAGRVAGPMVEYLARNPQNTITILDVNIENALSVAGNRVNCKADLLDVAKEEDLEKYMAQNNFVISLLPSALNLTIAKSCLKQKKHLVTASYISPELHALNPEFQKHKLVCLNEIGLDPGIDHLEAKKVIDEVHDQGGKIRQFVSWCGGVPLPEFSGNPFGYKFSWSPRGVLTAALKDAKYMQDGQIIQIPGKNLFKSRQEVNIFPGFNLEGIPNRDSLIYAKEYGIEGEVQTIFRGTLRYKGFCELMEALVVLGYVDEFKYPYLAKTSSPLTWNEASRLLLKLPNNSPLSTKEAVHQRLSTSTGFPFKGYSADQIHRIIDSLDWLGLFSQEKIALVETFIDALTLLMEKKMAYQPHENDMILLHHIFGIEWPNGKFETRTATLVVHGSEKASAMALTVGVPVAMATELVMDGIVSSPGVIAPLSKEIYAPLLKGLDNEGIQFFVRSEK